MSFVSVVRDYVDWINADFDAFHRTFGIPMTFWAFAKGNLTYICHLIKTGCLYLLTFQWLRDLAYLPVLIPEITLDSLQETFVGLSTLQKIPAFADFSFIGTSALVQNKILVGFFNSFFACLPLTFVHFIALRHLYVKGIEAALAINGGMIFGHLFFLSSVLFGWRSLLIPWLQCESWMYFLQIGLLLFYVRQALLPNRFVVAPLKKPGQILRTVLFGFILTIGDHGLCFRYMNSLTGGLEPTFVEPLSSTIQGTGSLTQQHLVYLFSFFLGSLLFTAGFFWIATSFRSWLAVRLRLVEEGSTGLAWDANIWCAPFCLSFFWVCLPFYSVDYLTYRPLGYMPYDQVFRPGKGASNTLEDLYVRVGDGIPYTSSELKSLQKPENRKNIANKFQDVPIVGEKIADSLGFGRSSIDSLRSISPSDRKPKRPPSQLTRARNSNLPVFPRQDIDLAHYNDGVLYRPAMIKTDYHPPWINEMYRISKAKLLMLRHHHLMASYKRPALKRLIKSRPVRSLYRRARTALKPLFGQPVKKRRKKRRTESTGQRLRPNLFRLWSAATMGQGANFGQFRVYNDFVTLFDPYDTPTLTLKDAEIGDEIDSLTQTLLKAKGRVRPATLAAAQRINELFLFYSPPSAVFPRNQNQQEDDEDEEPQDIDEDQEVFDETTSPIPVHSRTALLTALTSSFFLNQKTTMDPYHPQFQKPKDDQNTLVPLETKVFDRRKAGQGGGATSEARTGDGQEGQWGQAGLLEEGPQKRMMTLWPALFTYQTQPEIWTDYYERRFYRRLRMNLYTPFLLRTDIDSFLARQPKGQLLTAKEEKELYFKRLMLKNFLQTNAKYRRALWRDPSLRQVFYGTKTMAHRVYNHQFMGTFYSIRNLMRVDFNLKDPVNRSDRVMKYDMPLFTGDKSRLTSLHEEIPNLAKKRGRRLILPQARFYRAHLRPGNTRPFYAGWDEDRRAFVLTNRFLPTRVASRLMPLNQDYPQFASLRSLGVETKTKTLSAPWTKRIFFTTWPISPNISKDLLRYTERPRALMGRRPSTYSVVYPSLDELLAFFRKGIFPNMELRQSNNNLYLIRHFNPDYDFRPTQVLFEEMRRPKSSFPRLGEKLARRRAAQRLVNLTPKNPYPPETEFIISNQWPNGFFIDLNTKYLKNLWWFRERPPSPFADRGGYVWPGHQLLKVRGQYYLPKSPVFYLRKFTRKVSSFRFSWSSKVSSSSESKESSRH